MTRAAVALIAALVLTLTSAGGARAGIHDFRGHLSFGYTKLLITDAPGGSMSFGGGVDYPLREDVRVGLDAAYDLLGSRTVPRGSLVANVDYSTFDFALLAHWTPQSLGPIGRISAGPALVSTRAQLSTSGGGAAFLDLAVDDVVPGAQLTVTLISRHPAPVRVGFEVDSRVAFRHEENWFLESIRLTFHY